MEEPSSEMCLKVLRDAKSDNEKFAALLLIAKLTKAKPLSSEERNDLLSTVGLKFLTRLLKSKSAPEGCAASIYQSIALSILSGLCTEPHQIAQVGLKRNIEILNGIVLTNPGGTDGEDEVVTTMVADCYDILQNLASTAEGCDQLLANLTPITLCRIILDNLYGAERAEGVLRCMLSVVGPKVWLTHRQTKLLHSMMVHLVKSFNKFQDDNKFEMCGFLQQMLQSIPDDMVEECKKSTWLPVLVKTVREILTSRLGEDQRNPTLCLVAAMIDRLGVTTVLPPLTSDQQLLLVITHLSCIEIRMILENFPFEQVVEKADVLCSCYLLMENIIYYMTNSPSMKLDEKQVTQLHHAMVGSVNAILGFLREASEKETSNKYPEPVVIATIRVLGVWMSEETSALKEHTYALVPYLLKVCKQQVQSRKMAKVGGDGIKGCCNTPTGMSQQHNSQQDTTLTNQSQKSSVGKDNAGPVTSQDSPGSEVTQNINPAEENLLSSMEQCDIKCDDNKVSDISKQCEERNQSGQGNTADSNSVLESDILNNQNQRERNNNVTDISSHKSKSVSFSLEACGDCGSDDGLHDTGDNHSCDDVDLLRFLLPAFCHFMAEDESRQILLINHSQTLLVDYFKLCLSTVLEEEDSKQAKGSLLVVCGALMNLVVLEKDLISTDDDMHILCQVVMEAVPLLLNREEYLILWCNLVTLGMFLLLRQYKTSKVLSDQKSRFFVVVMSFVKGPFTIKSHKQKEVLQISDVYTPVWEDVSELWHLTLQAICECIPLSPVLSHTLLSTGVLPHWRKLLTKVSGKGVPDSVQDSILKLITAAVKTSPKVREVARTTGYPDISQTYKHTELQSLLT
ncbi:neurochondrin-like [Mizuhopecten yessoensis]|uniref:Neurochondrin n=1 Tax=Mizuhopecten yessoensis TaxID=6573 RepID=A0A210QQ84_MIZYE|nr:neurochondrin-like [Mizuhopecten yessoensis]XP_021352779.1 neurochondrin-like [Mizuhopecten yessoensis]OWF50874.1 Neurochondrin [Mizuhopecten yessoensis]